MANRNSQGFGLRPAMRVGNTPAISGQSKYEIDAGETNAIFNGEPVKVDISASTGGYIVTAAAGTAAVGVLNGVVYTDATTLKPTFSNFYPAATTPANSEDITAFVIDNPFQQYLASTSAQLGANAAAIEAQMGRTMGTAASAGSTLSGQSSNTLTVGSIHDINNTWRLLRIAEDPSNEDGTAANCTVVVVANKSQWFGTGTVSA